MSQLRAARAVARVLAPVSERTRLVVTYGNGPQVGLLALREDAYDDGDPYPLDVLDAESGGQIGYVVELALDNAIHHQATVTVITRVLIDARDPAFDDPTDFIGRSTRNATRVRWLPRVWFVKPATRPTCRATTSSRSGTATKRRMRSSSTWSRSGTPGVELLVGAVSDPTFGPAIAVSPGGVAAELLDDMAVRLTPLTD